MGYLRTPRGSVRSYRPRAMGDLPLCSKAQVGQQCTPDDQTSSGSGSTSTSDWLKNLFGSGSSSGTTTTTTTTSGGGAPTQQPAAPSFWDQITNVAKGIVGQQQAPAPVIAPSTGMSTGAIVAIGAVGLGAVFLLTRKKSEAK